MTPYDGSEAIGVDRWLDRQELRERGGRIRYRCLDCSHEPNSPYMAYRHHVSQRPHHRIALTTGHESQFSCCTAQGARK